MKTYGINSNSALFDISRPPKSVIASHSTQETEFKQLKEKIMLVYRDLITGQENSYIRNELNYIAGVNNSTRFWKQMNSALAYYYNYPFDSKKPVVLNSAFNDLTWVIDEEIDIYFYHFENCVLSPTGKIIEETLYFYLNSNKNEFCNFIEFSFRQNIISEILYREKRSRLVEVINGLFRLHKHDFEITPFVYDYEEWDCKHEKPIVVKYPKVISKSEPLLYEKNIEPALSVLNTSPFRQANIEFVGALRDYRNEDFSDCLTKCGSAYESVLKILSYKLKIHFSKNEPSVSDRIKLIAKHLKLDKSLIPTLTTTPVIRNKLSSAHGRGDNVVNTSRHVAQFAVNCTAASILLLINESNK